MTEPGKIDGDAIVFNRMSPAYHDPGCGLAIRHREKQSLISLGDLERFVKEHSLTASEALADGLRPCSACKKNDFKAWSAKRHEECLVDEFCRARCKKAECDCCVATVKRYKDWIERLPDALTGGMDGEQ